MYRKYFSFRLGLVLTACSAGAMLTALVDPVPAITADHMYAYSLAISSMGLVGYGLIVRARRLFLAQTLAQD